MSIPQPDLYIKKFKDISDEMLASIPKYTEKWTNHNPSDPGIVILEMLAWIADTTLYRIDRTPEEMYVSFLRLVAGSAGLEDVESLLKRPDLDRHYKQILTLLREVEEGNEKSSDEIKSAVLTFLGSRYRAVTEEDFQLLAIEATFDLKESKVKRAIVSAKEKKVEIIIVPDNWNELSDRNDLEYNNLIKTVSDYLDPRRLIGTVVDVRRPVFTDVIINMTVDFSPHVKNIVKVKNNIESRICNFLDPFVGGDQKNGWQYGRPLSIYEIAQIIEETEGVEKTISLIFDHDEALRIKKTEGFIVPKITIENKRRKVTSSHLDPKNYKQYTEKQYEQELRRTNGK